MEYIDEDTFMLTDYGAAHLYGIIPLFYSERSVNEMFTLSDRWLNDKKGEDIYLEKYDRKMYDAPSVAVDLVVLNEDESKILLIRADSTAKMTIRLNMRLPVSLWKRLLYPLILRKKIL